MLLSLHMGIALSRTILREGSPATITSGNTSVWISPVNNPHYLRQTTGTTYGANNEQKNARDCAKKESLAFPFSANIAILQEAF
ncbi:MAG: hypothetical protein HY913_03070 [Desulfomonile tiedjei]|nr:hypothetical protein [Desulfomonile tiedjei]